MGSTDIVEVNGLAPWAGAGPMRTFNEKLGIVSSDDEAEDPRADREQWLEWGHTMETIIADWYERNNGCKLLLGGPVHSLEHPHFWATLDRVVIGANRLVEIKNVGSPMLYSHWDASSSDGVPRYVRAQVTVAMAFHGARECDVVASVGGRPPHVWTVAFDSELADLLIAGAIRFWQLVQDGTPPPLDATPATKAYLRSKYPANTDRVIIEAPPEAEPIAATRIIAASDERVSSAMKRNCDAQLMAMIRDADGMRGEGWQMTWKLNDKGVRATRFTGKGDE
jgi:predicted phage-related endonuclease